MHKALRTTNNITVI